MVYTSEHDPLCYSETTTLKNKAGIVDADELEQFELSMTLTRAEEDWPVGVLDYDHYRAIHHHMFQDVYDWAGNTRTIRVGKGGNWFCYPEYIAGEMERIFASLADDGHLEGLSPDKFAIKPTLTLTSHLSPAITSPQNASRWPELERGCRRV